jgi:LacI family fructose operon transcriptional repressor
VVVIDRSVRGRALDMVVLDNVSAAVELTGHLVANGYHRLAGLFGEASITGEERCRGFQQALNAHGLKPHSIHFVAPRMAAGYAAASAIFEEGAVPDAILTSNSLLTAGVFQALRERGLKIPGDIALAGFDATEWGEFVDPPITVIAQPVEEIGCTATEMLFERIAHPERPAQHVLLRGRLQARGSSAPR